DADAVGFGAKRGLLEAGREDVAADSEQLYQGKREGRSPRPGFAAELVQADDCAAEDESSVSRARGDAEQEQQPGAVVAAAGEGRSGGGGVQLYGAAADDWV